MESQYMINTHYYKSNLIWSTVSRRVDVDVSGCGHTIGSPKTRSVEGDPLLWSYIHSELIVKYNIGLKTLLQQGISEPIFYGDLVYKFKRIVGKPNFSDQFKKIVKRYIRVGYNLDIMRQSACLVLNPITVYSYGFLFNCMTVGQASDSMTALT